jgi:hypothetical protein|tara:strand:+ start:575 stop:694 length:120 start_codon:yes stop_codon:yes gene_type:complete
VAVDIQVVLVEDPMEVEVGPTTQVQILLTQQEITPDMGV